MSPSECEYSPQGCVFHGFVPLLMGTRLDVLICGASRESCGAAWDKICAEGRKLESVMDRFSPESEVSGINASGVARMSEDMAEIIALCEHYRRSTGKLFDIGRGTVEWDSALNNVDSVPGGSGRMISIGNGNLDFGGFGKGLLLKRCSMILKEQGISTAYVDFGGSSILALGHHPYGDCWRVGVTDPYTGSVVRQLELVDMAMSTSGNQPGYEGHIIDPRSGVSVSGRKIVTVLSPDPLTAEVVSTASMIAAEDELRFIRENNDITAIFCS